MRSDPPMTFNTDEAKRVVVRSTPWSLICTVILAIAKWGFGAAVPLWFVFLPIALPWLIMLAVLTIIAVLGLICGVVFLLVLLAANVIDWIGRRRAVKSRERLFKAIQRSRP